MPIVSYTIQDEKGQNSTVSFNGVDGPSLPGWLGAGEQLAQLIANVVAGRVVAGRVCFEIDVSALTNNTITPGSDTEEGATFVLSTIDNFKTSFRVPTFLESLIIPSTRLVDQTDPAVQALLNAIAVGLTEGTEDIFFGTNRGEQLANVESARESFQKSRKFR